MGTVQKKNTKLEFRPQGNFHWKFLWLTDVRLAITRQMGLMVFYNCKDCRLTHSMSGSCWFRCMSFSFLWGGKWGGWKIKYLRDQAMHQVIFITLRSWPPTPFPSPDQHSVPALIKVGITLYSDYLLWAPCLQLKSLYLQEALIQRKYSIRV